MTLTITTEDRVASIIEAVKNRLPSDCHDSDVMYDCCTIIDEFHSNMREHVAPDKHSVSWRLTVAYRSGVICLCFQYKGERFDPTGADEVEPLPIEDRSIGGLGLSLISELSDKIDYTYRNGMNTLNVEVGTIGIPKEDDPCL
ncbi:ATP-binding protein [Marinobacter daepoensis]|uniref:ATP-binding protein n=1 Tax=Marinobacter daepoensis TaxID=262077 RepID=A0ABS3BHG2_9GAMM|nr:ATP-binding protein [Marinobacter daepoensis]MBN7771264.1 ATP-binding protein [Marinobacter daepoensis]MBY6033604.1 ATP-binding protein [Marinobacter daepoensis]MBY6079126.1 ATP-binding protein [Marinobacter daepoensis]